LVKRKTLFLQLEFFLHEALFLNIYTDDVAISMWKSWSTVEG